ncbi:MAG TPA: TRAM domain-containing protein, partial [Geminicoccaceae bacterium]
MPERTVPERTVEVVIEALGAGGDGLARIAGRPVHVPLTLPGDRVLIRLGGGSGGAPHAVVDHWIARRPRATPACRHFGSCGGCRLQHLDPAAYRAWIVAQVEAALRRRGLVGVGVRPPLVTPPGSRRRIRFAYERSGGGPVRLGLREAGTRRIVDLADCPVARPAIVGLLGPLRAALADLAPEQPGEVLVTETLAGLDVLLIRPGAPGLGERERLAALADGSDLARLSWTPAVGEVAEPLAARRPVRVAFGGLEVPLPPG